MLANNKMLANYKKVLTNAIYQLIIAIYQQGREDKTMSKKHKNKKDEKRLASLLLITGLIDLIKVIIELINNLLD